MVFCTQNEVFFVSIFISVKKKFLNIFIAIFIIIIIMIIIIYCYYTAGLSEENMNYHCYYV